MRKQKFNIHKECLNNFFWPKSFTTNTLCANVYKIYEYEKNQMPYCNVKKKIKNQISKIFGPLIEHGIHWPEYKLFSYT
jgi:hypothetical protein